MSLDPANYIEELDATQPPASDPASQSDDHMRAIKKAVTQTFPNGFDAGMSITQALLNGFEARVAALEAIPTPTATPPAHGTLTATTTGNYAVTGVGFQPSQVIFFAYGSGTGVGTQTEMSIAISNSGVIATGATGSGAYSGSGSGQATPDAWILIEGPASATVTKMRADVVSLDADGFTVNETVGGAQANVFWVAFE